MKKRILLLEDDRLLSETIEELLALEGYEVVLAYDGEEASQLTYDNRFDLYIFDINVPEIDGLSLLEALREAEDRTPAIFISALVDIETIASAFNVGAKDYIKKPFFPEEILIRVNAKFKTASEVITIDHIQYNPKERVVTDGDELIAMGEVQMCLFEQFVANLNRVVHQDALCDCLTQISSGALRVALNKLKQSTKLSIKNVGGVGYILETR